MLTITELVNRSHELAKEKGWYEGQQWPDGRVKSHAINVGERLALVHSEISEALEEYRKHGVIRRCPSCNGTGKVNDTTDHVMCDGAGFQEIYVENGKPEGFSVELADAVIRIFDLCGAVGVDLAAAIETKHAYNATRPYRHGGKRA